jgi:hypothetical protein
MPRFEKPKNKPVITRKEAKMIRANANNARKSGTPNDMIIAKSTEDLLDRCTIIDDN